MNLFSKAMVCVLALCALLSCRAAPTPTLAPTPTPAPTATPTAVPPTPTMRSYPTASTPAPETPVIPVGYTAILEDTQYGIAGKAVMAGLQTIVITNFTYDGQVADAEIRLIKRGDFANAVAVLGNLEQRVYDNELIVLTVPSHLQLWEADSIAIYSNGLQASLGWGLFK